MDGGGERGKRRAIAMGGGLGRRRVRTVGMDGGRSGRIRAHRMGRVVKVNGGWLRYGRFALD